jgi:hypothetical protein
MERWLADLAERLPFERRGTRGSDATLAVVAGLGGLALGAVLMYLFDPELGMRRRAQLADDAERLARRSGEAMDGASRDVVSRARGLVVELRSRLGREEENGPRRGESRGVEGYRPG